MITNSFEIRERTLEGSSGGGSKWAKAVSKVALGVIFLHYCLSNIWFSGNNN